VCVVFILYLTLQLFLVVADLDQVGLKAADLPLGQIACKWGCPAGGKGEGKGRGVVED